MRRDNQPLHLLVGVIGQRENDPGRMGALFSRMDLDAPDDAVRARRGGDLDAVALIGVILDPAREIDRLGVRRHAHRFHSVRGAGAGQKGEQRQEEQEGETQQARVTFSEEG